MNRAMRILLVTLGLFVAGGVLGGVAGAVGLAIALALTEGLAAATDVGLLTIGAFFGTALGAFAGPPAAWLALRRVPFGRMFSGSVAGTVVGGVIGWSLGPGLIPMDSALFGAFGGFCTAAFLMWRAAHRRRLPAG